MTYDHVGILAMPDCVIEELGHTAEVGLRIQADTPEQLFACSAQAMFGLLRIEPDNTRPAVQHEVTIDSIDRESLLIDWLSELLYLHETTDAIFTDCTISHWSPTRMQARVTGYPPTTPPTMHIKAVTYHQLLVQPDAEGWVAQVYLDI